jgi:hypothetical protein
MASAIVSPPSSHAVARISPGVLLFIALLLYYGCMTSRQLFQHDFRETGDFAANALKIENAKNFQEAYGNYSRWKFCHPGPFYWYAFAAGEKVFYKTFGIVPAQANAHILTLLILSVGGLAGGLRLISKCYDAPILLSLLSLLAMRTLVANSDNFIVHWPPFQVTIPLFLASTSALALSRGFAVALPVFTASSLVCLHAHVAQALFMGVVACFLVLQYVLSAKFRETLRWSVIPRSIRWVTIAIAGILLVPFLYDGILFLSDSPSNIDKILQHMRGKHGAANSWESGVQYCLMFLDPPTSGDRIPKGTLWENVQEHPWTVTLAVSVIAFNIVAVIRGVIVRSTWDKNANYATAMLGLMLLGASIFWAKIQDGQQYAFNAFFIYGVFFINCIPVLVSALRPLGRFGAWPLLLLTPLAWGTVNGDWQRRPQTFMAFPEEKLVRSPVAGRWMNVAKDKPVLLDFSNSDWSLGATLSAMLERRGVTWGVPEKWEFLVGPQHGFGRLIKEASAEGRSLQVWKICDMHALPNDEKGKKDWKIIDTYRLRICFGADAGADPTIYASQEIDRHLVMNGFSELNANGFQIQGKEASLFVPIKKISGPFDVQLWFAPLGSRASGTSELEIDVFGRRESYQVSGVQPLVVPIRELDFGDIQKFGGVVIQLRQQPSISTGLSLTKVALVTSRKL